VTRASLEKQRREKTATTYVRGANPQALLTNIPIIALMLIKITFHTQNSPVPSSYKLNKIRNYSDGSKDLNEN